MFYYLTLDLILLVCCAFIEGWFLWAVALYGRRYLTTGKDSKWLMLFLIFGYGGSIFTIALLLFVMGFDMGHLWVVPVDILLSLLVLALAFGVGLISLKGRVRELCIAAAG